MLSAVNILTMSDLINKNRHAQMIAGENAVIESLRAKGFDCGIPEPDEEFKPMNKFPKQAKGEYFSVPVLVFDENDNDFCEIGHYNFDTQSWSHFGENSMKLICWCYLPNPKEFLKSKNWISVEHDGYRP